MITFTIANSERQHVPIDSVDSVLHEMMLIEQDEDAQLAEDIVVYANQNGEPRSRLSVRLLNKIQGGTAIGWAVWFDSESPTVEVALFQRTPVGAKYRECLDCGCPQFIRLESIIHDKSLITTAIEGILTLQTPDPSLLWLPTDESIYLAPRSEWKRPECVSDNDYS